MINEWLCDMSHCCPQTRFWALNAPKMCFAAGALPRTPLGSLQRSPRPPSCVWGAASRQGRGGKGRKGDGRGRRGVEGNGMGGEMDPRNFENRSTPRWSAHAWWKLFEYTLHAKNIMRELTTCRWKVCCRNNRYRPAFVLNGNLWQRQRSVSVNQQRIALSVIDTRPVILQASTRLELNIAGH